jgi:DNA-binding SARP family transcriptional activator/Tfp pilus assembly protein PilF
VLFRLLGPVEVETGDGRLLTLPRRQERCLLAILLLEAGRTVSMDRLCDLLWEDNPPDQARQAVRTYVARIRALLAQAGGEDATALVAAGGGYVLRVEPDTVDAHRFRRLLDEAAKTADLAERDRLLREALGLWRGPALQSAASDRLRERLCADLDELRLHAVEELLATGLELGRHRDLLPELARLGAEHPTRERLVELHMLALYRDGRTAEALDVYSRARARLADELGLDPGPALQDLHTAVLRGEPIPPSGASRPAGDTRVRPAQLPSDLPAFAGRTAHLKQLDDLLNRSATAVVISAIAGTAGVGKTALAVHWAHRIRDRFPDGQLYVNLRGFDPRGNMSQPGDVIRRFLDALDVPAERVPGDLEAQIGLYRSLLADRRMLVVLDNARDPDQVRPLLPGAPGCLTVVTSRNRLTGLIAVDGAHPLALDLLTPDEARHLLAARLGADRIAAEPDAVDELVTLCARLPLALAIAAAHAATEPGLPLAALAGQLRDARAAHATGALDVLTGDDTATDIRAVFSWSYRALSDAAAQLFRLLGLHPGPDIAEPAAASLAGVPVTQLRPLLAELTRAHLVSEDALGRYTFHDLLRAYAMELVDGTDGAADRRAALDRMFGHYVRSAHAAAVLIQSHRDPITPVPLPDGAVTVDLADHDRAVDWFAAELPVLMAVVRQAADTGFDTQAWQLAWTLPEYLDRRGQWRDLSATQRIALESARRAGDRAGQAFSHRAIAIVDIRLGNFDTARTHLQHALDLYGELDDRIGQAASHFHLAQLFDHWGDLEQAVVHAGQAYELFKAADHRHGQARALNTVGWYQSQLGDHERALVSCEKSLDLLRELGDHEGEAATWDSVGYVYQQLGDHQRAVDCYLRSISMFREIGDRYYESLGLIHLGDARLALGEPEGAREAWQRAMTILDELDHPEAKQVRAKLRDLADDAI